MAPQRGVVGDGEVEVLLDDDDAQPPGPPGDGPPGGRTQPGGAARAAGAARVRGAGGAPVHGTRRGRAITLLLLALVVVVGANAAQAWRDRAATAALAGMPGLVPRVPDAPEILWSLDVPTGQPVEAGGDVLLLQDELGRAFAVDAASGATLWRAGTDGGSDWSDCRFVREAAEVVVTFGPWSPPASGSDAVVCAHRRTRGAATTSTLQVLDARTGAVRAERRAPGEPVVLDSVAGDVVHAERDAAGRVVVRRWDPRTDVDRWVHRLDGAQGDGREVDWLGIWLAGERLFVQREDGTEVRSLVDGTVVDGGSQPSVPVAMLAGGAALSLALDPEGTSDFLLTEADGSGRARVEGWFAGPHALDPGAPVVLMRDESGGLRAVDVQDGAQRWSRAPAPGEDVTSSWWGPQELPLVQVGHRLVLAAAGGRVQALDARDGTTLWEVEGLDAATPEALTDGRVVILPARLRDGQEAVGDVTQVPGPTDPDGEFVLLALDLRDGTEVWRVRLASPALTVRALGDLLLVQGQREVVAFRP